MPLAVVLDEIEKAPGLGTEVKDGSDGTREDSTLVVPASADSHGHPITPHVDFEEIEGQLLRVSISHDGNYCTAVALAPEMH